MDSLLRVSLGLGLALTLLAPLGAANRVIQSIDAAWYRTELLRNVDLWNNGLDGKTGMGVSQPGWKGLFKVHLDDRFVFFESPIDYYRNQSAIGQTRAIYMNCEAAAHAPDDSQAAAYAAIATLGADYLRSQAWDSEYGGYFWRLDHDGDYPPNGNSDSTSKDTYGNTFVIFAYANAYRVTGADKYLKLALAQIQFLYENFGDKSYPGGFVPSYDRAFTKTTGNKHFDPPVHLLEALMILHDHTEGATRQQVADWIRLEGDFIVKKMIRPRSGHSDQAYIAEEFTSTWAPHATNVEVRAGHMLETAFLLSRAVERGLGDATWIEAAQKIMNFSLEVFVDPQYGAVLNHNSDYQGVLQASGLNRSEWWHNTELCRAVAHFAVVRGRTDYWSLVDKSQAFLRDVQTDQTYGGLLNRLDVTDDGQGGKTFTNSGDPKSHIWKCNYHDSMYRAELIRLVEVYGAEPTLWDRAQKYANGGRVLPNFGTFWRAGGWIYQPELGWVGEGGGSADSWWLYDPTLGWLWTNDSVYPNVYRHTDGHWLLLLRGLGARWFYDYNTGGYVGP